MKKVKLNKRELLKNIALSSAVFLVCLIFLEIFLHLFWEKPGYGYPTDLFIPDENGGFKYRPNFIGKFPGTLYQDIEIKINSKGLRDDEHSYSKDNDTTRILAIGDSVTFGAGVKFEDTFLKKLEDKFINAGYKIEVIKAGINSYEFEQEYIFYTEEGYKYSPDVLLVGIVLNDAGKVDVNKIKERYFGGGMLSYQSIKEFFRNNCYSCNFFLFNTIVLKNKVLGRGGDYNDQYFHHVYDLWEGESWDYTKKQMGDLVEFVNSKNTQVVFVIFPYTQQFSNSKLNWGELPQETITGFGKEMDIMVIDLMPYLDMPDYEENYLFMDTVHLNEKGNEIVADAIYLELVDKGLI